MITETELQEIDRVVLDGPGVYVIDFKTAGVEHSQEYWARQLQSKWYPLAVQMEHPEWNVRGTVYDVIRKPRKKSDTPTFEAHFVPLDKNALTQLYPFVRQGAQKIDQARNSDWGNPSECVNSGFGGDNFCPFYGAECALTRSAS